jgi:hypothetical protein
MPLLEVFEKRDWGSGKLNLTTFGDSWEPSSFFRLFAPKLGAFVFDLLPLKVKPLEAYCPNVEVPTKVLLSPNENCFYSELCLLKVS